MSGCSFLKHGVYIYIYIYIYRYVCEQLPDAKRQFKSDCHQTSSVISLVTGDEVIKFCKVTVGGKRMLSTESPSSLNIFHYVVTRK